MFKRSSSYQGTTTASAGTAKSGVGGIITRSSNAGGATTASYGGNGIGSSGPATGVNLDPLLFDVAPETSDRDDFPLQLMQIYRDIYYYDSVAGATVDLLSTLPFSGWTLSGCEKGRINKFQESLERLNVEHLCPAITADYLIHGVFNAAMVFNKERKVFTDIIPMAPEDCKYISLPFFGQDPIIRYTVPQHKRKFMATKHPSATRSLERMGPALAAKFKSGSFDLDPLTSMFMPRQTTNSALGTSYFKRILPIYLVEKNLWKGTMIESTRRIRSILHIQAGGQDWEPTPDDMSRIASMFNEADVDPLGAIVSTRNDVTVNEVRQGGDFWNIFNIWGDTVPAKLRALGIGESFLSGDASYNTLETSLSVFLDKLRSDRDNFTNKMFNTRLFPLIALTNGFLKKGAKLPASAKDMNADDILRLMQDTSILDTPQMTWTKSLEPHGDSQVMDLLEKLEEKGVPVPLRMWAAAGDVQLDDVLAARASDIADRKAVAEYLKEKQAIEQEVGGSPGGEGDEGGGGVGEFSDGRRPKLMRRPAPGASNGGLPDLAKSLTNLSKGNIIAREYGEMSEIRRLSKSGNKVLPVANQKAEQRKANRAIFASLQSLQSKLGSSSKLSRSLRK